MESTVRTTQHSIINSTTVNYSRKDCILFDTAQHFVRRLKYTRCSYWSKELMDCCFQISQRWDLKKTKITRQWPDWKVSSNSFASSLVQLLFVPVSLKPPFLIDERLSKLPKLFQEKPCCWNLLKANNSRYRPRPLCGVTVLFLYLSIAFNLL